MLTFFCNMQASMRSLGADACCKKSHLEAYNRYSQAVFSGLVQKIELSGKDQDKKIQAVQAQVECVNPLVSALQFQQARLDDRLLSLESHRVRLGMLVADIDTHVTHLECAAEIDYDRRDDLEGFVRELAVRVRRLERNAVGRG